MKIFLRLFSFLFTLGAASAFALGISVYDSASQQADINNWISNQGGQVTVLDDFEGKTAGWYENLDTGVGTFTAGGNKGSGATSYNANNPYSTDPYFSIQDREKDWYGRSSTKDGSKWLDSGDITELTLSNIVPSLKNLFFYIQDPSDSRATTSINVNDKYNVELLPQQANGKSYFIGITLEDYEMFSQIVWTTSNATDGFGLDSFSTVSPVPEPATFILFGLGIAGVVGYRLRKKKK